MIFHEIFGKLAIFDHLNSLSALTAEKRLEFFMQWFFGEKLPVSNSCIFCGNKRIVFLNEGNSSKILEFEDDEQVLKGFIANFAWKWVIASCFKNADRKVDEINFLQRQSEMSENQRHIWQVRENN